MSILTRLFSGLFVCALTTPAFALGSKAPVLPAMLAGAQATAHVLTDSDRRRINHYARQTLEALHNLGTSETAVATLREKVQRLVDAGARSGISLLQTADYFAAYVAENNTAPLPGALLDAAGTFNTRSLFTATMMYLESQTAAQVDTAAIDEADLAAISSVAKRMPSSPNVPPRSPGVTSVVEAPVSVVETPVIAPDTPAPVRAILERVRVKGNDWVITVEPGDSLGQYASALYGDTLLFQRIYEANTTVLSTPNAITVGQELVLPKG